MEQSPFDYNASPEKNTEEKDKKKNKAKRFGSFVAPKLDALKAQPTKPEAEKSEPANIDKLLADLAIKKQEKQEAKDDLDTTTESETEKPEDTVEVDDAETPAEVPKGEYEVNRDHFDTDYTHEIKANELPPRKVFSEGVIDLGHEDEELIQLRRPSPATESQPDAAQESTEAAGAAVEAPEEARSEFMQDDEAERPTTPTRPLYTAYTPTNRTAEQPMQPAAAAESLVPLPGATPNIAPAVAAESAVPLAAMRPQTLEQDPNVLAAQYAETTTPRVESQPGITKQQLEDEVYYATKAGQRRGVLAGAVAAGAYEHFKHKRREKKQRKEAEQTQRQHAKEQEDYKFRLAAQEQKNAEQERALQTAQEGLATNRAEIAPVLTAVSPNQVSAQSYRDRTRERVRTPNVLASTQPEVVTKLAAAEAYPAGKPEASGNVQANGTEKIDIPEGHRLETSAWHTIEVDTKTGKVAENPSFAYGHEYYKEKAKEASPQTLAKRQAAGEVAIVAAAIADTNSASQTDGVPTDANVHQKSSPRQLLTAKAKSLLQSNKSSSQQQATGPLWPWLVAFVTVVFLLVIVL